MFIPNVSKEYLYYSHKNDCFAEGRDFAPAGATKGLCGRPLDTFAAPPDEGGRFMYRMEGVFRVPDGGDV